jgi:hypothetical protein
MAKTGFIKREKSGFFGNFLSLRSLSCLKSKDQKEPKPLILSYKALSLAIGQKSPKVKTVKRLKTSML